MGRLCRSNSTVSFSQFWIPLLVIGLLSSSPSPSPSLPTQPFLSLLFLFLSPCRTVGGVGAQSVEINVTVKEERLPNTQLADLMTEPQFLKTIQLNNGGTGVQNGTSTAAVRNGNDVGISSSNGIAGGGGGGATSKTTSTTMTTTNQQTPHLQFKVLSSGNPSSQYFYVDKTTGVIYIKETIDREIVCSFRRDCQLQFELAATSAYNVFFVLIDFRVTVLDINDNPPEFVNPEFDLFIPENAEQGRSFQLPTAFDRDTGPGNGVESYTLLEGAPSFRLDSVHTVTNKTDIYITLVSTVNRESAAFYKLVVGATDGGIPALTGLLAVNVKVSDVNDNFPVFERPVYVIEVPEDTRTDHSILQVKATDADEGDNGELVYAFSTLQPPDNLGFFRIEPGTGRLFLTRSIESRTGQDLELLVEAKDKGHPPKVSTCTVKIHVKDTVNSMPQIIIDPLAGGSSRVAEVSEYAGRGKVMLHVSVRDPDSGDNGRVDCHMDSPEFKLLKLTDDGKYKVALMTKLDRETVEFYNVTIFCSDHGFFSLLATARFSVRVLDENDHKPQFSQRVYETSIKENNTIGASVIQLTVTDMDIGKNAEVDFSVLGINHELFAVDDSGKMTAKVALNREESDRIVVKVMATDRGNPPLSSSATVVVDLIDINDMRPEFSQAVYTFYVDEEQPVGRYVGIVSASDGDLGDNARVSYLVASSHSSSSASSSSSPEFTVSADGGVLKTNAVLDREDVKIYEFRVEATDHGASALTGTARVVIRVSDVNDNIPHFTFPYRGNDSVSIPHTFESDATIIEATAVDDDTGRNAEITYSISSINASSPFAIDQNDGCVRLEEPMSSSDVGLYILTLIASDSNPDSQLSTQIPFYVEVYFDNSTLLASVDSAGPSQTIIVILSVIGLCILIGALIFFTFVCIRRSEAKKRGAFPLSASTSSTTKLQGGYYIAPGVRASSSTFLNKPDTSMAMMTSAGGLVNGHLVDSGSDGSPSSPDSGPQGLGRGSMQVGNPYTVMLPNSPTAQPEIVEISRGANRNQRLDDTLNTLDLDQTDDGQFSTFKSQENILAPLPRHDSLRRQSTGTSVYKSGNDTFDDLSCYNDDDDEDSTSDSGRGGSDVDGNSGAAALKDKARAKASTPISIKSGISDRLSPLPQDQRGGGGGGGGAFLTFRGESPSSFKFDSDSDSTLTRHSSALRSRLHPHHAHPHPPPHLPLITGLNGGIARCEDYSLQPGNRNSYNNNNNNNGPYRPAFPTANGSDDTANTADSSEFNGPSPLGLTHPHPHSHPHHHRLPLHNQPPSSLANMYNNNTNNTNPNASSSGYNSGGEGPSRQPFRVSALPTFIPPNGHQLRYDDDANQLSDGAGSSSSHSSSHRRNHVPRLPTYSGIDFSHHAYGGGGGGSNRNSIGAFSNISTPSNSDGCQTDNEQRGHSQPHHNNNNNNNYNKNSKNSHNGPSNNSYNNNNNLRTSFLPPLQQRPPSYHQSNNRSSVSGLPEPVDSVFSSRYNNVVSELQTSRPVSMEEDFLLPPYPEVVEEEEEDEENNRTPVPSRYRGRGNSNSVGGADGERDALVL